MDQGNMYTISTEASQEEEEEEEGGISMLEVESESESGCIQSFSSLAMDGREEDVYVHQFHRRKHCRRALKEHAIDDLYDSDRGNSSEASARKGKRKRYPAKYLYDYEQEAFDDEESEMAMGPVMQCKVGGVMQCKGKGDKRDKRKRKRTVILNFAPASNSVSCPRFCVRKETEAYVGVDGVGSGSFRARYRSRYLGRFKTPEEAAQAHDLAALKELNEGDAEKPMPQKKRGKGRPKPEMDEDGEGSVLLKSKKKKKKKRKKKRKNMGSTAAYLSPLIGSLKGDGEGAAHRDDESNHLPVQRERLNVMGPPLESLSISINVCDRDIALGAGEMQFPIPASIANLLAGSEASSTFLMDLIDEKEEVLLLQASLASVSSAFLRVSGAWGPYARSRQISSEDTVDAILHVHTHPQCRNTHVIVGQLYLRRKSPPPPIRILEPNVESEVLPEDLGFCYVRGRLTQKGILASLGKMQDMRELPLYLRQYQDIYHKVPYRMRVVFVGPERGYGVWLLESVPKGEILFEYAGEIISSKDASSRERTYLEKDKDKTRKGRAPHYIYEILQEKKPLVILDSTYFGNVSRFVNHRCVDANLEVLYLTKRAKGHRLLFRTKRDIQAGEELTVDYSPALPAESLKRKLRCYCGSKRCRGWVF